MILEQPSVRFEAIHSILSSDGNILTVSELCETAGVSRSGYYRWLAAAGAREKRETRDREDFELILEAYRHRGYQKGARSIYMSLLHRDPPVVMNVKKSGGSWINTACPARSGKQTHTGGWQKHCGQAMWRITC